MKRLTGLLVVLSLCIVCVSFGQEEPPKSYVSKGHWLLGGTMSLSTSEDFKTPTFTISPTVGYFIANRWALGSEIRYSISDGSTVNPVTGEVISVTLNSISFVPFARYYFGTKKIAPFAEVGYGWSGYYTDGEKSDDSEHYRVAGGLNYFITPSLAVEGKLSYTHPDGDASFKPITLGIGLQFFLSRNQNAGGNESSQTFLERGGWMIGGNIGLTFTENDYRTYTINPMAGYFITDRIAAGLSLSYQYSGGPYSKANFITGAPFVRYYFATSRFAPFVDAGFGGSFTSSEFDNGYITGDFENESFSYQAGAGFNYFITNNVALESRLGYYRNLDNYEGSVSLTAGLKFFLPRKK